MRASLPCLRLLAAGLLVQVAAACAPGAVGFDTADLDHGDLAWAWGDLHAHSAWSFDGCEEPDVACTHDADGPGAGFFPVAAEQGLDFAALTDHAEADFYRFEADALHPEGAVYDVWEGQQYLAVLADGGPVLPLLGYEWTAVTDELNQLGPGSHRTVILGATRACEAYRVSGKLFPDGEHVLEAGERAFSQDGRPVEPSPQGLWLALSDAVLAPGCEPVRWASFAHHPAYLVPQATDWSQPDNAPHMEQVVEIYSEHGSSECGDPGRDGCGWALNEAQGYHPPGSVQAALDRGFRLGFVAGTDSHDARPGSIADGPSPVAHWPEGESAGPQRQFAPGGLTGLLAPRPLTRDDVMDALQASRTIATSGPRPALSVQATGRDGTLYLPGEEIPRWNLPAGLALAVGELDPAGTLTWDQVDTVVIERIADGGRVVSSTTGELFGDSWDPGPDERWTYLRVRLRRSGEVAADDPLGGEERVWVSPWFVGPAGACSTGGSGGGGLAGLLAIVLLSARSAARRRPARPG